MTKRMKKKGRRGSKKNRQISYLQRGGQLAAFHTYKTPPALVKDAVTEAKLIAWYDAMDPFGTGVLGTSQSDIGGWNNNRKWADKSGNGNDLYVWDGTVSYTTSIGTALAPLHENYPYPAFKMMSGGMRTNTTPKVSKTMSAFIVGVLLTPVNNNGTLWGHFENHDVEINIRRGSGGQGPISARISGTDNYIISGSTMYTKTPFLYSINMSPANVQGGANGPPDYLDCHYFRLDTRQTIRTSNHTTPGVGLSSTVTPKNAKIYVGASETREYASYYICEIIYYQDLVSNEHREEIEGYLAWKWGIEDAFHNEHGYRLGSPYFTPQYSGAYASGQQASAAEASNAIASGQIASAAEASSALASSAIASAAIASNAEPSAQVASSAIASAAWASGQQASNAGASNAIASAAISVGDNKALGRFILPRSADTNPIQTVITTDYTTPVRYVRIRPPVPSMNGTMDAIEQATGHSLITSITQIAVFTSPIGNNIALNRPIYQASPRTIAPLSISAKNLVNGTYGPWNGTYFCSGKAFIFSSSDDFVEIDLGSAQTIYSVVIYISFNTNQTQYCSPLQKVRNRNTKSIRIELNPSTESSIQQSYNTQQAFIDTPMKYYYAFMKGDYIGGINGDGVLPVLKTVYTDSTDPAVIRARGNVVFLAYDVATVAGVTSGTTKMVLNNSPSDGKGTCKYYNGTPEQYDPANWSTYATVPVGKYFIVHLGDPNGYDTQLLEETASGQIVSAAQASTAIASAAKASYAIASSAQVSNAIASGQIASSALASNAIASAARASNAVASSAIASSAIASGQTAYVEGVFREASAADAQRDIESAAYASGQFASSAQASNAVASGQIASGQIASAAVASGQIASAMHASGQQASNAQASNAIASGQIASGQVASAAEASGQIASAAFASGQVASNSVASGQIASAAYASGQQASAAIASAAIPSGQIASAMQASNAKASGQIASGQIASSAKASGQIASAAEASNARASGQIASSAVASSAFASGQVASSAIASNAQHLENVASAAYASGQIASAAQASNAQASGQIASAMRASNAQASGQIASAMRASSAEASGQIASAMRASSAEASGQIASAAQASNAEASGQIASSAEASNAVASAAYASGQKASGQVASAAQVSNARASAPIASAAIASSAVASAAFASGQVASGQVASSAIASSAVASAAQFSAAEVSYASALISFGQDDSNGKFILPNNSNNQTVETNNYSGRYVRIRPAKERGDGWLNLSQIIVKDSTGVVLSQGKMVYATSTMAGTADASTLTNGKESLRNFPDIWSNELGNKENDFVEIDLEEDQPIYSVQILGRGDCGTEQWCKDRMYNLRIELLSTTTDDATSYYTQYNPKNIAAIQASAANAFSRYGNDPKNGKFLLSTNKKDQVIYTNQLSGRYIRIRPSVNYGDGFLNITQIIVYDLLGMNVSQGKPVFATSSHPRSASASILVDGSTQPRKYPKVWHSNTPNRDTEYVEIDLGIVQYITGIRILGVSSCPTVLGNCNDRMIELRVEVNNDTSDSAKEKYEAVLGYLSFCGSSNASDIITIVSSENNIPIVRQDPSLPSGYTRYWNTKCRGYLYQDSDGQIVLHPLGPRQRSYWALVKRVPNVYVPTREEEASILAGIPIAAPAPAPAPALITASSAPVSSVPAPSAPMKGGFASLGDILSLPVDTTTTKCVLWLDANDPYGNGSVPGSGTAIDTWIDKSPTSHHARTINRDRYNDVLAKANDQVQADWDADPTLRYPTEKISKTTLRVHWDMYNTGANGISMPQLRNDAKTNNRNAIYFPAVGNLSANKTNTGVGYITDPFKSTKVNTIFAVVILSLEYVSTINYGCLFLQTRQEVGASATESSQNHDGEYSLQIRRNASQAALRPRLAGNDFQNAYVTPDSKIPILLTFITNPNGSATNTNMRMRQFNPNGTLYDQSINPNGQLNVKYSKAVQLGVSDFIKSGAPSEGLNGYIHEILHFQTAINDTDMKKIEGYLAWKWGIQNSLDNGHPYSAAAMEAIKGVSAAKAAADIVSAATASNARAYQDIQDRIASAAFAQGQIDSAATASNARAYQDIQDRIASAAYAQAQIVSSAKASGQIASSAIASAAVASAAFASAAIPSGQIASAMQASNAKASGQIASAAKAQYDRDSGAIASAAIASSAIASSAHASGQIASGQQASNAQASSAIASGQIASSAKASNAQASGQIASAMRASNAQASGQIASAMRASNAEASGQIASAMRASNAEASGQIASSAQASNAVASGQIASSAVASAAVLKIAQDSAAFAQEVMDVASAATAQAAIESAATAQTAIESAAYVRAEASAAKAQADIYAALVASAAKASAATAFKDQASAAKASAAIAAKFKPLPMDVQILSDPTVPKPWMKFFDTAIRKYFYVEPIKYKEMWEHPTVPPQPIIQSESYVDPSLPKGWKKFADPVTNIFYYFDTKTTETTWDHPNPPPYPERFGQANSADLSILYKRFTYPNSSNGVNKFFYNTLTSETFWEFPRKSDSAILAVNKPENIPEITSDLISRYAATENIKVTPTPENTSITPNTSSNPPNTPNPPNSSNNPNNPNTPNPPNTPNNPNNPNTPNPPNSPNNPNNPNNPNTANNPNTPNSPNNPNTPNTPNNRNTPNTPNNRNTPNTPNTSNIADTPVDIDDTPVDTPANINLDTSADINPYTPPDISPYKDTKKNTRGNATNIAQRVAAGLYDGGGIKKIFRI